MRTWLIAGIALAASNGAALAQDAAARRASVQAFVLPIAKEKMIAA
jgi:hypothetical protein